MDTSPEKRAKDFRGAAATLNRSITQIGWLIRGCSDQEQAIYLTEALHSVQDAYARINPVANKLSVDHPAAPREEEPKPAKRTRARKGS